MNQIIITGNIGKEPKFFMGKGAVLSFSVASKKKGRDGKFYDTWHNVVAFGELADSGNDNLHSGARVIVVGSLRNRKYTNQAGQEKYVTEVVANEIGTLLPKKQGDPGYHQSMYERPEEDIPFD